MNFEGALVALRGGKKIRCITCYVDGEFYVLRGTRVIKHHVDDYESPVRSFDVDWMLFGDWEIVEEVTNRQ